MLTKRTIRSTAVTLFAAVFAFPAQAAELDPEGVTFFETKIRPVLVKECYGCHSNKTGAARGGLRLDTQRLSHLGGDSGPAIVPGDLDESLLWSAINHDSFLMPPKRKLSDDVIEDFRTWIEMGAPDPRETKIAEIKSSITEEDIREAKENFWAYKKPTKVDPPSVEHPAWPRTAIDHFVLAKLESAEIEPAGDAASYKVLRRLCFDLTGLPPTTEQIEMFDRDWRSDPDTAVETVVNQLLSSEQFGERWGRHWLDVARYAESTGRAVNMTFPHAWRYRDYVIDAFNDDKPFDQFIEEQLAGDLLSVDTDEQWTDNLIATTFLALGPKNVNEQNGVQFAADLADEQIDTTTRVFLGTSVACARCHDHKFDPIPQTDYYAMAGVFRSMKTYFGNPPSQYGNFNGVQARRTSSLLLLPVEDPNSFDRQMSADEKQRLEEQLQNSLGELGELGRQRRLAQSGQGVPSQNAANIQRQFIRLQTVIADLSAKLAVIDEDGYPRSYCMGAQNNDVVGDARVLVRGEIDQPGQVVRRDVPQVLRDQSLDIPGESSGRLELARWISSEDNPLTARVMVNRIWQHLIGQGLVTTTENFGATGQAPSHPELLDHLAVRFMESGWSVKSIVRDIATSRVYRISSEFNEDYHEQDPDNALVWRANPRRLDAEAIRDAMLVASGDIDLNRPRASEVAKAGYVRVRDGNLGGAATSRMVADRMRQMGRGDMMAGPAGRFYRDTGERGFDRNRMREAFQRGRGPGGFGQNDFRPGMGGFNRRPSPAEVQRFREMAVATAQSGLDMNHAKYRSVYLPVVRDSVPRSLAVFDFAESTMVIGKRETSNTPNQALYLMNNPFVIAQSEALASKLIEEKKTTADRVQEAFLVTYGRPPTSGERLAMVTFAKRFEKASDREQPGLSTFTALCQSLFSAAEFRYID